MKQRNNPDESMLRPLFTQQLAQRLMHGASINLVAPHGYGRRQTLRDLRSILPPEVSVLYADMKYYREDCAGMLAALSTQLNLKTVASNLCQLIEELALIDQPALLILHNIDLLRYATYQQPYNPAFDVALLPYLKNFTEHDKLALLTVSEAVYVDWPLPCDALLLPKLSEQ